MWLPDPKHTLKTEVQEVTAVENGIQLWISHRRPAVLLGWTEILAGHGDDPAASS